MPASICSRVDRRGEKTATSRPGRSAAARNSVATPPGPSVTTGPNSSVQRSPSSHSPPGDGSYGMNSLTE